MRKWFPMSESKEAGDQPGAYDQPENEQQDSAKPLDHRALDDEQSVGEKVSEQQREDEQSGGGEGAQRDHESTGGQIGQ